MAESNIYVFPQMGDNYELVLVCSMRCCAGLTILLMMGTQPAEHGHVRQVLTCTLPACTSGTTK
jgi:hypothetical protein